MADHIKVFLSYRRADTSHVAGRIADRIGETFELFMDIDTIPPGVDFTEYVRRAVGSCDVLLAFIGEQWSRLTDEGGRRRLDDPQDWVVEEIRVALQRGVRVIPVLVDEAVLPPADELPEPLRPLINRQALPLRHTSFTADAARLIAAIQHAGESRRAERSAAAGSSDHFAERWNSEPVRGAPVSVVLAAPKRTPPRWLLPAIVAAVLIVAALLLVIVRPWIPTSSSAGAAGPSAVKPPPAGSPAESSASRPAETKKPGPAPARTVAELRARIPAALRASCRQWQPEPDVLRASLLVAVQCLPPAAMTAPRYLFYFSYANPPTATQAFRAYYAPGELDPSDCTRTAGEQTYSEQGGRAGTAGTLRCYTDHTGLTVFAWTNESLSILASAADPTLGYAELKQWWELAGPLGEG